MENDLTREEVVKSIVPNSQQLNADDMLAGPLTVTITGVRRGNAEQPISVEIEGHQPYKPCKTMRRVLIATYGDNPANWIGQRLTLYCDPDVKWGGVKVGGIRISHMTGLDTPRSYMLTSTRGKRSEVTIQPLAQQENTDKPFIEETTRQIEAAGTLDALKEIADTLKVKSKAIQDALRPIYATRQKELKAASAINETPLQSFAKKLKGIHTTAEASQALEDFQADPERTFEEQEESIKLTEARIAEIEK